jgi:guanylate kinase
MICILGPSAAGKSSIERALELHGYNRIISYTSRPIRCNEKKDIDYHFISEELFLKRMNEENFFSEATTYRDWHYGIAKKDCKNNAIAVIEPTGYRQLKKIKNLNITSFLIKSDERTRLIRMAKRGDDITEIFRRLFSDQGAFNGIEKEVDFIIENLDGKLDYAVDDILQILQKIGGIK